MYIYVTIAEVLPMYIYVTIAEVLPMYIALGLTSLGSYAYP